MRMFAYVRFTDGWPLILPTTMIRKCSPSNDEDFDAARIYQAYWVSDCNEQQDYYDAKILLLGASLDELLKKMQAKRYAIPRIVGGSTQHAPPAAKHVQDLGHKEKKKQKESGKRARLEGIAANFRKTQKKTKETEACSHSQDDMVPMHVFKEQETMIKKLKRQLVEERSHSRRLAQALATKIEVASGQSWDRPGTSGECFSLLSYHPQRMLDGWRTNHVQWRMPSRILPWCLQPLPQDIHLLGRGNTCQGRCCRIKSQHNRLQFREPTNSWQAMSRRIYPFLRLYHELLIPRHLPNNWQQTKCSRIYLFP
ncbi:unnamed protein product [Ixodes hexagonus]